MVVPLRMVRRVKKQMVAHHPLLGCAGSAGGAAGDGK